MKRQFLQWASNSCTRLTCIALLAFGGLSFVHAYPIKEPAPWYSRKVGASRAAQAALQALQRHQSARNKSAPIVGFEGLIGPKSSIITSDRGYLAAKQAALNPNFAALIVEWLRLAGAKPGGAVAVALSGSFPALNISILCALRELNLSPAIASSASSSNWGANDPSFSWLDMENLLYQRGLICSRSQLVSIGGDGDCGGGVAPQGIALLKTKIENFGLPYLNCQSTHQSISKRMQLYQQLSSGVPLTAYINVGGNVASVSRREKHLLQPGLNRAFPHLSEPLSDSVALRMGRAKIPVIHLVQVRQLADKYHLEKTGPNFTVGRASVYFNCRYNPKFAGGLLAILLLSLRVLIRPGSPKEGDQVP